MEISQGAYPLLRCQAHYKEVHREQGTCVSGDTGGGDLPYLQTAPGANYYHDGEQVLSGNKFLFRSDVMYRKVEASKERDFASPFE